MHACLPADRLRAQRRPRLGAWLLVAVVACLAACANYGLVRYADGDRPSVALVTLDNDSAEPGLEMIVSSALRREILRRGGARLTPAVAGADWVIRGRIVDVATNAASLSTVVMALEHRIVLALEVRVEAADGRKLAIPPSALSESDRVLASADLEVSRTQRTEALRRLSDVLAVRIHDHLDQAWAR